MYYQTNTVRNAHFAKVLNSRLPSVFIKPHVHAINCNSINNLSTFIFFYILFNIAASTEECLLNTHIFNTN